MRRFSQKNFSHRAGSTLEYMALIVFFLTAFLFMRKYIIQGLSGKWKIAGDTFGLGRQYDPRPFGRGGELGGTLECYYEEAIDQWIDRRAAEFFGCDCTLPKTDPDYATKCVGCAVNAANPQCWQ